MRVFLAGATGAVGRPLLRQLLEAGHQVIAITRSAERSRSLINAGAEAVVCDAFDKDALRRTVKEARPNVVIDQMTDLPQRVTPTRRGIKRFYRGQLELERHAKPALLEAALAAEAPRYVMQSIAFTYAPDGSTLRSESDLPFVAAPPPWRVVLPPLLALERDVTEAAHLQGIVLRYGFFYGPGTSYAPGGQAHEDVLHRRFPLIGDGEGVWSFVHVEDAASAAIAAVERGDPGIYNIVDDDPAPLRTWLRAYAAQLGAKPPRRIPALLATAVSGSLPVHWATRMPGVSNERAKRELLWSPRYPSWRDGFRKLVRRG